MAGVIALPAKRALLIGTQRKPYVVGISGQAVGGTSIDIVLPSRERDVLLVSFTQNIQTGIPTLPSGWTSLANSSTNPSYRIMYRFCDGSEAPTVNQTSTVSVMNNLCYAIKGVLRTVAPTHGGGAGSLNPASFATAGYEGRTILYLVYGMWAQVTPGPPFFGSGPGLCTLYNRQVSGNAAGVAVHGVRMATLTFDPSTFAVNAGGGSIQSRSGVVAVAA